jgi:hypothetical protein
MTVGAESYKKDVDPLEFVRLADVDLTTHSPARPPPASQTA